MARVNAAPGNLIRWGSKQCLSPAYAVMCGCAHDSIPAGCDAATLVIVLSTGGTPCTEVGSYPSGSIVVPLDGDEIIA